MIDVTTEYLDAIRRSYRRISYKVTVGSTELTEDDIQSMELEYCAGNDDCVGIGSTVASRLSLNLIRTENTPEVITLQEIVPYVGIEVAGSVSWVKLGQFYPVPSMVHKTDLLITAECYDRMTDFDGYAYTSALTYPATVGDVVAELESDYGITIMIAEDVKDVAVPKLLAETVRGVFSAVGILTGTFCMVDRDGNIVFKNYTATGFEIDGENYKTFSLTSDENCSITGLKCIVAATDEEGNESEEELMAGDSSGVSIEISGSYLTDQEQLDAIYNRCLPVTYQPYTLELQGMPHIEAGDIIKLTDKHDNEYDLYVVNHRLYLDGGGLKSEMTAAMPDTSNGTNGEGAGSGTFVDGSLIAQVQKLRLDMIEAKKIVAGTVTADWVTSNFLNTTDAEIYYAKIDQTNIDTAWVNKLFVKGGFITEDIEAATGSFSSYLTGVRILGDLIEANTLKANTLILQGEDGIYRRLNIDALGEAVVDSDEKYNTGLDGSILVAESITADKIHAGAVTADKINVATLEAICAKIGGFSIGDTALYNGTESLAGADESVYLGIDGISCGTGFAVTRDGDLTATAGEIAGWNITEDAFLSEFSGTMQFGTTVPFTGTITTKLISKYESVTVAFTGLSGGTTSMFPVIQFDLEDTKNSITEGISRIGIGRRNDDDYQSYHSMILHNSKGSYIDIGHNIEMVGDTDIDGSIYTTDNLYFYTKNRAIYGRGNSGIWKNLFQPQNSNYNTVIGYGNYANAEGLTNIYGVDISIFSATAGNAGVRPYYRKGDKVWVAGYVGGFVTNSKSTICFTINLDRPILGTPTVTVTSSSGLVIRQDGLYTHGSDGSSYAKPDSYTTKWQGPYGIGVCAKFDSVTTNAVNNAAAGITFSLYVELS